MMKMKKILLNAAFILAVTLLGGCDDFFNPDTDVTLDNDCLLYTSDAADE